MLDFSFITKFNSLNLTKTFPLDKEIFFESLEGIRTETPFVAQIETTNICSFQCIMCPRGRGKMTRKLGYMSRDVFYGVIDQLKEFENVYNENKAKISTLENPWDIYEIVGLRLHHFGEPLLDPLLVDRIKFIKKHTNFLVHFSTTPIHLHEELSEDIIQAGLDRIIFALDSTDNKTYKKIRGINVDYALAIDNVNYFLEKKLELNSNIEVDVQFISLEKNKHQEKNFFNLWSNKPVNIIIKNFAAYPNVPRSISTLDRKIPPFCKRPFHSICILQDGKAVPCSFNYNGNDIIGDIKKDTIIGIWNSEAFLSFRKNFCLNTLPEESPCHNCGEYIWNLI